MLESLFFDLSFKAVALVTLAGLLAGLARGFSGFGAALIFVPLASSVVGPKVAVPLLTVIDGVMSLGLIPGAWRQCDRAGVLMMSAGALIGVPLGALALTHIDPLTIRWSIVVIVVLTLCLLLSGWRYRGKPKAPITVAVGATSGVFSGVAQIGGPPVVAYWLGGAIPVGVVRANIILFFAISGAISAVTYFGNGLITRSVLALSLAAGPAYGLGLWGGAHMFGLASERTFRWLCLGLIVFSAIIGLPVLDRFLR